MRSLGLRSSGNLRNILSLRRRINGILVERVSIDGTWLTLDGKPVYMEI
ncbi:hypothetical protein FHS78_000627 [Parvibaculum indicum]|nr:hypothetical protein [Parvibaculum indicum]